MATTELELETVTPMFLHGHNTDHLELRPPPFKASFRYWWRATRVISGADRLRREETALFGNTRQRSPLQIRIPGSVNLEHGEYQPLPHHTGGYSCGNCPAPPRPRNQACRKGYEKEAYCPNQNFSIILTDTPLYTNVANLSFLLGGVGNRSRRGFGSVGNIAWKFANINDLRNHILTTLDIVANPGDFVIHFNSIISTLGGFPSYPVIREIFFGQSNPNFNVLLEKIGQATHDNDVDALGYASNGRMASPIHVRIQKVGSEYFPIVTQLHWNYPGYRLKDLKTQQAFINQIIR